MMCVRMRFRTLPTTGDSLVNKTLRFRNSNHVQTHPQSPRDSGIQRHVCVRTFKYLRQTNGLCLTGGEPKTYVVSEAFYSQPRLVLLVVEPSRQAAKGLVSEYGERVMPVLFWLAITFIFQLSGQSVVTCVYLSPSLYFPSPLSCRGLNMPTARRCCIYLGLLTNSLAISKQKNTRVRQFSLLCFETAWILTPSFIW